MKAQVFRDVVLCQKLNISWPFERLHCVLLQGQVIQSSWTAWPGRWRRYIPMMYWWIFSCWYGVTSQKTWIFKSTFTFTSVKSAGKIDVNFISQHLVHYNRSWHSEELNQSLNIDTQLLKFKISECWSKFLWISRDWWLL